MGQLDWMDDDSGFAGLREKISQPQRQIYGILEPGVLSDLYFTSNDSGSGVLLYRAGMRGHSSTSGLHLGGKFCVDGGGILVRENLVSRVQAHNAEHLLELSGIWQRQWGRRAAYRKCRRHRRLP